MKKLFLIFLGLTTFLACNKSNDNTPPDNFPKSAETKPQYDNTSFGVYKGVIIGSTGTIVLRINNGDTIVKAFLSIGNIKDTLSTTQQLTAGQPIVNLNFSGKLTSLTLSANADGTNAQLTNLNIPGHPDAVAIIIHENSTHQVLCYEGTFTGELTGNISFIRIVSSNNTDPLYPLQYISRITNDTFTVIGQGRIAVDTSGYSHIFTESGQTVRNFNGMGKFTGNTFSGYWTAWWAAVGGKRGDFVCTRTY